MVEKAIKYLEESGQADIARAFRKLQHEFEQLRKAVIIGIVLIGLGTAAGIFALKSETSARTNQFCHLIVSRDNSLIDQYNQTITYFKTRAGQEKNGINQAIKANFPRQKKQLAAELKSFPGTCGRSKLIKQHG